MSTIIDRYDISFVFMEFRRVRKAKADRVEVIDVDGTYLERKRQKLLSANINVAPLPHPAFPLHGWTTVEESNSKDIAKQLTTYYFTNISLHLPCRRCWKQQGFNGLSSFEERLRALGIWRMEVQTRHQNFAFIRSVMIPSMWSGTYSVKILLKTKWLGMYARHPVDVPSLFPLSLSSDLEQCTSGVRASRA